MLVAAAIRAVSPGSSCLRDSSVEFGTLIMMGIEALSIAAADLSPTLSLSGPSEGISAAWPDRGHCRLQ